MSGETNPGAMLARLSPKLIDGDYVFCSFPAAAYGDHADLEPVAAIRETEGLTLVIPRCSADEKGLHYDSVFRGISPSVHSSLDAVGLTAAVASKLAGYGISANLVAGYYHDHMFVQHDQAANAIEAFRELSN